MEVGKSKEGYFRLGQCRIIINTSRIHTSFFWKTTNFIPLKFHTIQYVQYIHIIILQGLFRWGMAVEISWLL